MKKLYFAISVIILIFVVYISFQTLAGKGKISSANNIPGQILVEKEETNIELLVSGTFNYNSSYNHSEPALIHINPNNDFSINIIDLKKFNLYYYGLHEVRPIMINNEHKIVLGTYTLNASYKKPKLIILDKSNGFDNLQMEFEEEIDDERIRAVFVEDIDNDGEKEIVIGTRPNGILKYYKFANNQWTGFQLDFINATIHDILVEDINSNNRKEIITTVTPHEKNITRNLSNKIISYEFDPYKKVWKKEIIWEYNIIMTNLSLSGKTEHARYLFAFDVDHDGLKEIVVNARGTGNIELFRYNGTSYSREIIEDKLNIHSSAIAVGDIDSDGKDEIIALTEPENTLLMYEHNNGVWEREILVDDLITNEYNRIKYLFIINSTDNSYAKILYAAANADFYYLEHDNNVWNKNYIGTTNNSSIVMTNIWGIFPA